jgi:hypothetical protein
VADCLNVVRVDQEAAASQEPDNARPSGGAQIAGRPKYTPGIQPQAVMRELHVARNELTAQVHSSQQPVNMQSLHDAGLRVVQDVVYNHTYASGLDRYSVLDKVVPGYYHRRTETGQVCDSTCVFHQHRVGVITWCFFHCWKPILQWT